MSKADMGKIMVTPKGEYSSVTQYERLDIVRDGNSVYLSKESVKNVAPDSDANKWMKLVDGTTPNAIASASAIYDNVNYAQVAHVTGVAENSPTDLNSKIEPVQNFNDYDAPWPAGGGKNLFNPALFPDRTASGITSEIQSDGTIHLYGVATATTRYSTPDSVGNNILLPAGTYKVTGSPYAVRARNNKTVISDGGVFTVDGVTSIRLSLALTNGEEMDVYEKIQIEVGETATDWAPYENTCPISGWTDVTIDVSETSSFSEARSYNVVFPASAGTVYGGILSVYMNGNAVLTVDRILLNLGELSYTKGSNNNYYYATLETPLVRESSTSAIPDLLCDILPVVSASDVNTPRVDYGISLSTINNRVHVRYVSVENATQLKAALTGHIAVARLTEPVVYTFSAEYILLGYGENYVKSNAGDVSMKYILDTKTYIDSRIAALMNA